MTLTQLLAAKAAGLTTLNQVEILLLLAAIGPLPMNRLGERLGITTAAITGLIDRLTALRLVQRSAQPSDRRLVLSSLTPSGARLALKIGRHQIPA